MIKVISFDFDGTLVNTGLADSFWMEGLPNIYAVEKYISFKKAKELLVEEYNKIGKDRIEWYDPDYWFDRFGIKYNWKRLMNSYRDRIKKYDDATPILESLKKDYDLIILSNARREFIDLQLDTTGLERFFKRTFSSVSDFNMVKKNAEVYHRICDILEVKLSEIVHVGDDLIFDYEVPKSIGIKAFYLDRRSSGRVDNNTIHSLYELKELINKF